jgi:acyl-CoA dehydrogenase
MGGPREAVGEAAGAGRLTPPVSSMFTPEHELFRATVQQFVEKEMAPYAEAWEAAGEFPRPLWQRLGELGFLGLEYPEAYGGVGADLLTSVVLWEELARCRSNGVAMGVFVHTDMASPHLWHEGTDAQKRRWLPAICRGEAVCAIAVTEPGGGSDVAGLRTRARREGSRFLLNGSKMFITNGIQADLYFVAARTSDPPAGKRARGISMFVVEKGTPGFQVSRKLEKMGNLPSDTAELTFDDVPVPADHLLGELDRGFRAIMRNFQRERLVAVIHAVSASQQALEDTIAYARERVAFGQTLAQMPVLRHKLAEMASQITQARAFAYDLCRRYAAGEDCTTEISMAKYLTAELANRVAYEAVQIFGGYGYMREFPIERFYRDARLWTIGGGTSEIMKEIIAKRLGL